MTTFWVFCSITLFVNTWPQGCSERVLDRVTDDFDFDGIPGAQHEFKFEIAAGKQECFYQSMVSGGTLHVSFQVLRGGDRHVAVLLKTSGDAVETLHKTDPNGHGAFQHGPVTDNGEYAICVDNTMTHMASKLVYMFIVTHVEDEWSRYAEEMRSMRLTETNVTTSIQNVQESLTEAFVHQAESRMHVVRDWYLVTGNNTYIQRWSIGQCIVIILCSGIQVFFVRRLFRGYNVTPASKKPKA